MRKKCHPTRCGRNGISLKQGHEVEKAASEGTKGYVQLGLGVEEPMLLQTAKAQHRKELANWQPSEVGNPFELSQRTPKDLGMKKGS